jgi:sec-independent protein translocase protein TatC
MRKTLRSVWRIISAPFRFILWLIRIISSWSVHTFCDMRELLTTEVEDEPLADTFTKTLENPMGLMEHLNALRNHLFRALVFLLITTSLSFAITPRIIDEMAKPIGGISYLKAIDVTEPIGVFMRVALLSGFAFALPYIIFELWLFAAPGLKRKSRLFSLAAIPMAFVLFIGGMAFAYFIMLPVGIPFLIHFMGINTEPTPNNYVRFVTGVLFWIGVSFEFPLVIYILAMIGLVKAKFLKDQWRLAVVLIAILAAAVTPTVDPINMSIVMLPMVILYFLSIGLAYFAQRGHQQT